MIHISKNTLITLCGLHSVFFALFHACFWQLFRWKQELSKIGKHNKAIVQILNLRLIYIFLLVALICFCCGEELYTTHIGRFFLCGMAVFWLGRTLEQFIFLRINSLAVHLLTLLFILGMVLFALPLMS